MMLTASAQAAPPSHRDELFTFATAIAVGDVVADRCRDLRVDRTGLEALGKALHITSADDMALGVEHRMFAKTFGEQADKAGDRAWCDDVYVTFGPHGTLMRGFLHRW